MAETKDKDTTQEFSRAEIMAALHEIRASEARIIEANRQSIHEEIAALEKRVMGRLFTVFGRLFGVVKSEAEK